MPNPNAANSVWNTINTPQKKESLYTKLFRDFSRHKLKDAWSRAAFVTSLRATPGTIPTDIVTEISQYAWRKSEYDGMDPVDPNQHYYAMERETSAYFSTLTNKRQNARDAIFLEYDVSQADFLRKSADKIEELDEVQLDALISSERVRKSFLEEVYENGDMPEHKSLSSFLKDFNLEKRYKFLSDDQKGDFQDVVDKIQRGEKLEVEDVETIVESGVYNSKEQKKLLEKMVPSISLKKAKELRILGDDDIDGIKTDLVSSVFDWDDATVAAIVSDIKDEDIRIPTNQIIQDAWLRKKLADDPLIFQPFVDKYGSFIEKVNTKMQDSSLKKKSDFLEHLAMNQKVAWAPAMQVGSIIEIEQHQMWEGWESEAVKIYGEIVEMWDQWKFKIKEKGYNVYNKAGTQVEEHSYSEFLSFLQNGNSTKKITPVKMRVLSTTELNQEIRNGNIEQDGTDTLDFESRKSIKKKISETTGEIANLEQKISEREKEIRDQLHDDRTNGGNNYSDIEIEEKVQEDGIVKGLKEELAKLEKLRNEDTQNLKDINGLNVSKFKEYIKKLDPEGEKFGFDKGTTFETKDEIYVIRSIDPVTKTVFISSIAWDESIKFDNFYTTFQKQKAKRVWNAKSFDEVFLKAQENDFDGNTWKDFSLKREKIYKKKSEDKAIGEIGYNYLGWADNKELVRIESIEGDHVTLSFGQLIEKPRKEWGEQVTDEKFEIFSNLSHKSFHISYLGAYIAKHKLIPRSLKEKQEVSSEDWDEHKLKHQFNFASFFFQNLSIIEAVKGWTQFVETIKEIMQQWQEEHSLQFANNYLGKVLPKWARRELLVRLENSQKKRGEDYIERLRNVDSKIATEMIRTYLLDKHGPEYQKEAAVSFMFQKYWVLNAKTLQDLEGTFTWYQALGWKKGDELYMSVKAEMDKESLPLTEEYLVYMLIKRQCWEKGYKWKKRRSKLHKELKKQRAQGKEEERETWVRDGNDQRTLDWRVAGGMSEMESNNYPNMVWWLEVAVNKGGPMHLMNKIPFVAAFSGVAYNFEEKVTDDLKNFPAKTRLLMMLRFFSHHRDLETLNGAIMRVCELLAAKGGDYADIANDARPIFKDRRSAGEGNGIKDKIKRTEDFYNKYGKVLTDVMYMLNTWESEDNLNKLIFFEKDKPGNEVLAEYYGKLHTFIDADTKFGDEALMEDPFKHAGTSWLELHKVTEELLITRYGVWTKKHAGPFMWEEVQKEFEAIPHRDYAGDGNPSSAENRSLQIAILKDNFQRFLSWIFKISGSNSKELTSYNSPTWPFSKLNTWGIDMQKFIDLWEREEVNYEWILHGEPKYQSLLQEFSENVIKVEAYGEDFSSRMRSANTWGSSTIKDSVSNIVRPNNNPLQWWIDSTRRSVSNNLSDGYGYEEYEG